MQKFYRKTKTKKKQPEQFNKLSASATTWAVNKLSAHKEALPDPGALIILSNATAVHTVLGLAAAQNVTPSVVQGRKILYGNVFWWALYASLNSKQPPSTAESTTDSTVGSSLQSILRCPNLSSVENKKLSVVHRYHRKNVKLLRATERSIWRLYPHYTEWKNTLESVSIQ